MTGREASCRHSERAGAARQRAMVDEEAVECQGSSIDCWVGSGKVRPRVLSPGTRLSVWPHLPRPPIRCLTNFLFPQVPVALAGHTGEFMCLVVVSDHRLYLLKVTGEMR